MIVNKILEYLSKDGVDIDEALQKEVGEIAGFSFKRQFMEEEREHSKMYLSAIGKCARQNAYRFLNFEKKGRAIDTRASINFFIGDIAELTIMCLAKLSGCKVSNYGLNQKKVVLKAQNSEINGYPDGDYEHDDGSLWNVEVKSMPSFRFEAFERGDIDEDYLSQANIYAHVKGQKGTVFIALNKNNGVFQEKILPIDESRLKIDLDNLSKVLSASADNLPEAKYRANEKGFYDFRCTYCAWWGHCHPTAELTLVKNSYKLQEGDKTLWDNSATGQKNTAGLSNSMTKKASPENISGIVL